MDTLRFNTTDQGQHTPALVRPPQLACRNLSPRQANDTLCFACPMRRLMCLLAIFACHPQNSATSLTATAIGGFAGIFTRRDDDGAPPDKPWVLGMGSVNLALRAAVDGSSVVQNILTQGEGMVLGVPGPSQ